MTDQIIDKQPDENKLITSTIAELNASKRIIGLYPPEHPKIRESMSKAYGCLKKLLDMKGTVTVGIAKDVLMVGEDILDKKNPGLREFALDLHSKGIAAITFSPELRIEELTALHELITLKDGPIGKALADMTEGREIRNIMLTPLEISKFRFVENVLRKDELNQKLWEEYTTGLLEGTLADDQVEDALHDMPPEDLAALINSKKTGEDDSGKTCEGIIGIYMGAKRTEQKNVIFSRLLSLIDNLDQGIREEFLRKSLEQPFLSSKKIDLLLDDLTSSDIEMMMKVFNELSTVLPENLRNLMNRLGDSMSTSFSLIAGSDRAYIDDIELDENLIRSFVDDHKKSYVDKGYQRLLAKVKTPHEFKKSALVLRVEEEFMNDNFDRIATAIMFELLHAGTNSKDDYLEILNRLIEVMKNYIDTGRFSEISDIYNKIYYDTIAGTFRDVAALVLKQTFNSEEILLRIIESFKIWGRFDRERVYGLSVVLKNYLIRPVLDSLMNESDLSVRRFFLDLLVNIGPDVLQSAVERLNDGRWYVLRNMIYLIRECGGLMYIQNIRNLAKHQDRRVSLEAVKTLLQFGTADSVSYVKYYLQSREPDLRDQGVRLAGTYRVKEALPYLTEMLDKKDLTGVAIDLKVLLIRSMAGIGDPSVLGQFTKIYNSSGLLNRGELERLKVEIFRNLYNFPLTAVRPLLNLGIKSKNEHIRALAEKMLKTNSEYDK